MWLRRSRRKASSQPARLTFCRIEMRAGVSTNDVDGEPSQNSEVLWRIVFSGSAAILVEHDVEHPMQAIFDTPISPRSLQQPFGGHVLGRRVITRDRFVRQACRGDVCAM